MRAPDRDADPRPVATVDLGALRRNVGRLRRRAGEAEMLVAVKANAYGHGLVPVARALARAGVGWLGVATPDEALALRRAGVGVRVLLFGPVRGPALARLLAADVDLTVADEDDVAAVARARETLARAAPAAPVARLHLKVDTGMGRLGLPPGRSVDVAGAVAAREGLELTAAWTHLARADEPDAPTTARQLEAFEGALARLEAAGLRPRLRHAANSAALLAFPEARYDLVRPGIAAYGVAPGPAFDEAAAELEPVMTLEAPVVFAKRVPAGTAVSYGHAWRAPRETGVATVRIGYADGYLRALSGRGHARVAGAPATVAGTVCMDQTLLDVGDAEVRVGDRAVLFGADGPGVAELAARIGTIPYELLTAVGERVLRRYVGVRPPA